MEMFTTQSRFEVFIICASDDLLLQWPTQLHFFWHTPWHPLPVETCSKRPDRKVKKGNFLQELS